MLTNVRPLLLGVLLLTACATSTPSQSSSAPPAPVATTRPAATIAPTVIEVPAATTAPAPAATTQPTPLETNKRAYFVDPSGGVYAWNLTAHTRERIAHIPAAAAVLSPNGTLLAFNNNGEFVLRDLRSGVETNMTPEASKTERLVPLSPFRWSPDSRSVLFDLEVDDADPPQPTIFRADVGGGMARPLVAGIGPAWSPDGHLFAFAGAPFEGESPHGGGPSGHLAMAHVEGSNTHVHAIGGSAQVFPAYQPILWSEDGTHLSAADVVVDAASGSVTARAPHHDGADVIAIVHLAPNGRSFGVWRVTRAIAPNQSDPGIFFETDEFLWVREDGQATTVARGEEGSCPCMPLASILWTAWQADGAHALVAGSMKYDSPSGVWLYTASDQRMRRLSNKLQVTEALSSPLWSADQRYVLFADDVELWQVELASGTATPIGKGQWLGWAP